MKPDLAEQLASALRDYDGKAMQARTARLKAQVAAEPDTTVLLSKDDALWLLAVANYVDTLLKTLRDLVTR
jgi:hypothetical protein